VVGCGLWFVGCWLLLLAVGGVVGGAVFDFFLRCVCGGKVAGNYNDTPSSDYHMAWQAIRHS
jgi:hypothetical protein